MFIIENAKFFISVLGHSLVKIAIGTTVSYVQNINDNTPLKNPDDVLPFIPFAYLLILTLELDNQSLYS